MSDRELLEWAAKAANVPIIWVEGWRCFLIPDDGDANLSSSSPVWDPLGDDGDAFRLAVKLGMWIYIGAPHEDASTSVSLPEFDNVERHNGDADAATRRAITRAAAEIGKATAPAGEGV